MNGQTLKEKTASGLLWGALNNMTMQVLNALIGIVLSRLLLPSDYGMMGMLTVFTAIAGSIQESGFTSALCNLRQATHDDYNAVFWFTTFMSIALYGVLWLAAPFIAAYFHHPELVTLSRLVFASLMLAGIGATHAAWMFRNMMNREKAIINAVAMLVSGSLGIALACAGLSYWSLAWQQFAYMFITNVMRLYYVRWLPTLHFDFSPIRRMFGFSFKIMLTNIINQVNNNVLSLIFGRLFTAAAVGNYTQASKWNNMGTSFISGTIQQVAQPVLVKVGGEQGRQLNVFRKMVRFAAFMSMPAMFGLALIADFVPLVLGERWNDTVILLRLLCISGAFMPLHSLYQNLFISNGRSDTYMWCTVAQVTLQIIVILAFGPYGIQAMVMAYSAMLILWLGVWQFIARRMVGIRFRDVLLDVCPFMLIALACVTVAWFATRGISSPVMSIASRIAVTATLYIGIMKLSGAKIFDDCVRFLLKKDKL